VFLYHAIRAGMSMGIVNAGQLALYEDIEPELREARARCDTRRAAATATERLLEVAARFQGEAGMKRVTDLAWRDWPVNQRLAHALVHGIDEYVVADTEEARLQSPRPLDVIEGR